MKNPIEQNQDFFINMIQLFKKFKNRIINVVQSVMERAAPGAMGSSQVLSVAAIEEIEMMCGLMSQMFEQTDLWWQRDEQTFEELKTLMFVGIVRLLGECDSKQILPSSATEQNLSNTTAQDEQNTNAGQMTALQLKIEIGLQRIMMTCSHSMLQVLNHLKRKPEMKVNRDLQDEKQIFDLYQQAQNRLIVKYQHALNNQQLEILLQKLQQMLKNDQNISNEYQGGLGSYFLAASVQEMTNLMNVTMVMSVFVTCDVLEMIRTTLQDVQRYDDYQDQRDLVSMASQTLDTVMGMKDQFESWDINQYQKILDYVQSVKENPNAGMTQIYGFN